LAIIKRDSSELFETMREYEHVRISAFISNVDRRFSGLACYQRSYPERNYEFHSRFCNKPRGDRVLNKCVEQYFYG